MQMKLGLCPQIRITKTRCIIFILMSMVLYNEWLSHTFCAMNWTVVDDVKEEHVKVLIAADPQILSTDTEPRFPFNYITTWDADRFVSRGFQLALWRTKPDIVIFLGDVLDDGSISNDDRFSDKVQHFKDLLHIPPYVKHTIYVPGDNDIGGEGMDEVTPHKISRFFSAFKQSDVVSYKFLDFILINVLDRSMNTTKGIPDDTSRMRVLLSHLPLLTITRKHIKKMIVEQHPTVIFSGHEHDSFHFIGLKSVARAEEFWARKDDASVWKLGTSTEKLHEITVPTCSYRMGKKSYGYGSAIIGKSGTIHYNVLWLPSRFQQLWMYLLSLTVVLLIALSNMLLSCKAYVFHLCKKCVYFLMSVGPKYHRI